MIAVALRRSRARRRSPPPASSTGIVLNAIGPHILRFLPPLVCGKSEVDTLLTSFMRYCTRPRLLTTRRRGDACTPGRDLLTLGELTPADVRAVLDLAKAQKARVDARATVPRRWRARPPRSSS